MLEIIVQLVPYGDRAGESVIAKAKIGNISSGTPNVCDYLVELSDDRGMKAAFNATEVTRDEDVWRFITNVLQQQPERPKDPITDHTTKLYDPKCHPNRGEHEKKR